jgi:hypothetical protein
MVLGTPDLTEGGQWHQDRVKNLRKAAANLPNPEEIVLDGLEKLHIHRKNYTRTHHDPKSCRYFGGKFPQNIGMTYEMGAQ